MRSGSRTDCDRLKAELSKKRSLLRMHVLHFRHRDQDAMCRDDAVMKSNLERLDEIREALLFPLLEDDDVD